MTARPTESMLSITNKKSQWEHLERNTAMKSDMELQRDILDEILWEPSTYTPDIGVIVHDGIVTLTGSVENLPAKWGAERATLRVSGVKAVANEIEETVH